MLLALVLSLSMVVGITGAWFTDKANGRANAPEGQFGTVAIAFTEGAAGSWSALDVTTGVERVLPGSILTMNGGLIENQSDVKVYVQLVVSDVVVKIYDSGTASGNATLTLNYADRATNHFEDYFTMPAFGLIDTSNAADKDETGFVDYVKAVYESHDGYYLLDKQDTGAHKHGDELRVLGTTLTVNTTVENADATAYDSTNLIAKIKNGAAIQVTYRVDVYAVQADNHANWASVTTALTALQA